MRASAHDATFGEGEEPLVKDRVNRLSLLVDLASLLTREVDFDALLRTACERVAEALSAERASIWLVDAEQGDLVTRVAMLPELPALRLPLGRGLAGWVASSGESVRIRDASSDPRFDPSIDRTTGFSTRAILAVPIREGGPAERRPVRGVLQVLNRAGRIDEGWDEEDQRYLEALAVQIAGALSFTTLRPEREDGPGFTLRGPFNRIVGRSDALERVYERVTRASATDATVLFRGETGTGKGLFARAVHVNSRRQRGPFVTVDCTTLPTALVESELFGHERGAFTGADRRVPGKVEMAEGGTIFLDEIGDLPLDVQGKLLRFLQERAFERVGGRQTQKADVRIVCATHQHLERAVDEGRFREDLYYRIRVVEIDIPPLRARGSTEIENLALHFADMYARRYERPAPVLTEDARVRLREHAWPGNVRELEHWIESAVVLSDDGRIGPDELPTPRRVGDAPETKGAVLQVGLTLEEATRRYVEATLAACDGNKTEAARRLGIGRNTLSRLLNGGP